MVAPMSRTRRPLQRLIAVAVLASLGLALTACSGSGINNFDPSDMLDFLDTKKKLPGERKPVFPEGVPGLDQGVPQELYRSNVERQQQEAAAAAAAEQQAATPPPATTQRPKRAPKAARSSSRPSRATPPAPQPAEQPAEPAPPAARQQPSAPQQPAQTQAPFPAPLPSGGFSR